MGHPKYKLGCIPDIRNHADEVVSLVKPRIFPPKVDLRLKMPAVYDQGQLGSCTANAAAAVYEYELVKQGLLDWKPSRLMLYYLERELENSISSDSGAMMSDGIKALITTGVCDERIWPYHIAQFRVKPNATAYAQAKNPHHHALKARRLAMTLQDIKASLIGGNPPCLGFAVYSSFYDIGSDGKMPLPQPGENLEGGHEVVVAGYDDTIRAGIIRNSWGPDWGDKGYFYMPYSYMIDQMYAFDYWNISKIA